MKKMGVAVLLIGVIGVLAAMFPGCGGYKEGPVRFTTLRSEYKTLSDSDVISMLKSRGFFDKRWNKSHKFTNQLELKAVEDQKIVIDHATGLAWMQAGSDTPIPYSEAALWIKNINQKGFAGYVNWRLPTLEEAASLLEQKKINYRYIDPLFSSLQHSIHTGDNYSDTRIWGVSYQYGGSFRVGIMEPNYVRAVTKFTGN